MPYCKQCGERMDKEARFCPHCGHVMVKRKAGPLQRAGLIGLPVLLIAVLAAGAFFFLKDGKLNLPGVFNNEAEQADSPVTAELSAEDIRDFLIKADRLKLAIEYEIEDDIIGRCDSMEVRKISGIYAEFDQVVRLLESCFSPEMAAVELRKINLCALGAEVGAVAGEQEAAPVTEQSEFFILEDMPDLKQVEVRSGPGGEEIITYTLEKRENGSWIITGSSAAGWTKKVKYVGGWQFEASSIFAEVVQGQKVVYNPERAFDFNRETAWVEGVSGDGIGEWIAVQSEHEQPLSGIEILNGFAKSRQTYFNNNRVKKILIEFSDGTSINAELEDGSDMELQVIEFGREIITGSLKLTVLDIYPGEKYKDTCISEIRVFQRIQP